MIIYNNVEGENIMKLSDKIRKLRKLNGWTQEELAVKINVDYDDIIGYENGSKLPDSSIILKMSVLFEVTTDYLLNDKDDSLSIISIDPQINNDIKLYLIACVAFGISTIVWLYLAIEQSIVINTVLACVNLILTFVNMYLFIKSERNKKKIK